MMNKHSAIALLSAFEWLMNLHFISHGDTSEAFDLTNFTANYLNGFTQSIKSQNIPFCHINRPFVGITIVPRRYSFSTT